MRIFNCKTNKNPSRFIAMIVAVGILISPLQGCAAASLKPTEKKFSEVQYQRPDGQAIVDLIDKAAEQAENDLLPLGMISTLNDISAATEEYYTMMTVAQIRNYADVNDKFYSAEMEYLDTFDARIQNNYDRLFSKIKQSKFESMIDEIFGESGAQDRQMSAQASSEDTLSLQEQEKKLVAKYYYEYARATVTTPEGEVQFSSLDSDGQSAYYKQFIDKYNKQLGELYLELVTIREKMAKQLGYDSYTKVADLDMLRNSYTRKDVQNFRNELKTTLAPVYREYMTDFYSRAASKEKPGYVYLLEEPSPELSGSWKDTLKNFEDVYSKMSDKTGECYSYLLSHQFIDAAPSAAKANVTFSTMLYNLNTPFLFANMSGSADDVFSISHEFGHCFAMWEQLKRGSKQEGRSMDVCEIHSQAMQVLTMPYYSEFYGDKADVAARYDVYTVAAGILTAAMNDEFQEKIYQNPDQSVDELNALYLKLSKEYGLVVDSPYFDSSSFSKSWFTTNQYFDTPFYAIDYALSGCVAMEFLQLSLDDYDKALDTYFELVSQSCEYDFMTSLKKTGLSSPFEKEQTQKTAKLLKSFMDGDVKFKTKGAKK